MQTLTRTLSSAPVLLGLFALAASQVARAADEPVKGEVLVILAKEADGAYDPKLKQIPALQQPPFSAFKSMTVLSTTAIELTADKDVSVALPNGSTLHLKLLERMADGRHKVQATITEPGKQEPRLTMIAIASSEPFFIAGQKHEGGKLVIGVRATGGAKK